MSFESLHFKAVETSLLNLRCQWRILEPQLGVTDAYAV
jgi:hypothetical protein